MPTLKANGLDIGYVVEGGGPPLVALHGATSSGRLDFGPQLPVLSRRFRVYLPDARGHGRTRWDAADGFRWDWLLDDLRGAVDALGLETFHLVGFSMGAMTALQFASSEPDRIRTLVVVGITPEREPRATVLRRSMDPDRIDREEPQWAADLSSRFDPVQGPGAWRTLLPAIAGDVATQPLLTANELHAIDAPTLVVVGDRDPFTPAEHALALRRQLPDGRLFVAPECGHHVMSERPALFIEALAGFYRSTEPTAIARAERRDERLRDDTEALP